MQMKEAEILLCWISHPGVAGRLWDGVAVMQPSATQAG